MSLLGRFARRALVPCDRVDGDVEIRDADPAIGVHHHAIYVPNRLGPFEADRDWGLYEADGALIEDAAYRRGPGGMRVGQGDRTALRPHAVGARRGTHLYAGTIHSHYGHFVLTSIARLWPLLESHPDATILYHGNHDGPVWTSWPFAKAILAALDLSPDRFLRPTEPLSLEAVVVPAPSFEETSFAHRLHGRLGAAIADRLLGPVRPDRNERPVYLPKTRVAHGVWRIENEIELVGHLERRGVGIVHPEELAFADQIRLFETHDTVVSTVSSALHTSLFARAPSRIIGLGWSRMVMSNQLLVDRIKGTRATYVHPRSGLTRVAGSDAFQLHLRLKDPRATAEDLLRLVDARRG